MPTAPIRYFSTNTAIFGSPGLEERISSGQVPTAGLAEAIIKGQAPDGGLFIPSRFPQMNLEKISSLKGAPYSRFFTEVMRGFFDGVLSESTLDRISTEGYNFEPYIEKISKIDFIGRLDTGPTAAFKDYAAQVLFRVIEALMKEEPKTEIEFRSRLKDIKLLSFIVATSGDTGGAMGSACYGRDRMWMSILHSAFIPQHVSELQAKQMELDKNIYAIRVKGFFDDCASLASRLIADPELQYMNPNSANSVNIGRLLPQIAYYFYLYSKIANLGEEIMFSVPSGNFGNAVAGLYARKMGLPIKLIIGVNENDVFDRFYRTGLYQPAETTHPSPSSAMNVNMPSNVKRLVQLYGGQLIDGKITVMPNMEHLREDMVSYQISDAETDRIIEDYYKAHHKIESLHSTVESHGAVAWGASQKYRQETGYDGKIITFETAHPGKFPERIRAMGIEPELPECLAKLVNKPHGRFYTVENDYEQVKYLVKMLHRDELRRIA